MSDNHTQDEPQAASGQARPLVVVRYKSKITRDQYATLHQRVSDKLDEIGWGCMITDDQGINEVKVYGVQREMLMGMDPFDLLVALANIHAPDSYYAWLSERLAHTAPGSVSMENYKD